MQCLELIDCYQGKQLALDHPRDPQCSRGEAEGRKMRVEQKENSLFPVGTVINCFFFTPPN